MLNTFLIFQIVLSILIVIVVLMQKSSSIGLGVYSGSNESLFGSKGPASFLAKLTFFLGVLFLANTIALGYSFNKDHKKSLIDTIEQKSAIPQNPLNNKLQAPSAPTPPPFDKKEK